MTKELSSYLPDSFNLNNHELSKFFVDVALYLNLDADEITGEERDIIKHGAEILKEISRRFRGYVESTTLDEKLFFWEFYGKKEERMSAETRELYADRLTIMSERLDMASDGLYEENKKGLTDFCLNLSRKTGEWWSRYNPTGFKRYFD